MSDKKWENAFQFLAGYFYQGFAVEFGEPEVAIIKFIESNDKVTRAAVARELREILGRYDEEDLENVVFGLGCYYSPQRHQGITMCEWLTQIAGEIEQSC
jgi:hypothetical protein